MNLEKEVSENYDIDIKSFGPFKDGFLVVTNNEKLILKKSNLSNERLLFIHAAKEHLFKNKFENIDRYICTYDGKPFISVENTNYVMINYIEGIECNFDNKSEIVNISRLLASFHKASKGFAPQGNIVKRSDLGKMPLLFSKRLDEIKKLKKVAKKGKTKFDYLFLQNYDYFSNIAEHALNSINNSNYKEIVNKTREDGIFCHHDFTHHNILHTDKKYFIVNFDFCCYELKVYDIANFLRRKMRKCNWSINEARIILNEYRQIEEITEDEMKILKIILQFPQKFWRVVNKYYNSKRSWSEKSFVIRLQEVIDEIESHKQFIENFDQLFI
jgi:CotS family spore coat protein